MTDVLVVQRNKSLPAPELLLTYSDGSVPNLTGATVHFVMRALGAATPKVDAAAAINDIPTADVSYAWDINAGDVDTVENYRANFVVTFQDGRVEPFPTEGFLEVRVQDDLAAAPTDPAYCLPSDLLLGDLQLGSSVDPTAYIVRAAREIQTTLAQKYVVPITTTNAVTKDVLRLVNADLASAYLIMAVASPSEDGRVNAYAMALWQRANAKIKLYLEELNLPGADLETGAATDYTASPVGVKNEDSKSGLTAFYDYVQDPLYFPIPPYTPAWVAGK